MSLFPCSVVSLYWDAVLHFPAPKDLYEVELIPPTILCIDDSESILECLNVFLSMESYRVLTASGGAEGLEILERTQLTQLFSTATCLK